MGSSAGGAEEGRDRYHAVANAAVYETEKVAFMGTIMGKGRGRSAAAGARRHIREVRPKQRGNDLVIIKMFDFVKGLANVQVKSYHNGECYIGHMVNHGPELRGRSAGRHSSFLFQLTEFQKQPGLTT